MTDLIQGIAARITSKSKALTANMQDDVFCGINLGVCPGRQWSGDRSRCVLVCPGGHPLSAVTYIWPLMAFLREGWSAVEYVDAYAGGGGEAHEWVSERAEAAAARIPEGAQVIVLGKSLGSLAAGVAAARNWPAVWLTPLLTDRLLVEKLRDAQMPKLLVGGTADPHWDGKLAREIGDVAELEGADHSLGTADPLETLDCLKAVVQHTTAFAHSLPGHSKR